MFYYTAAFVFLRTFIQIVCDDYTSKGEVCEHLIKKAFAETLPDIRSAYFLKVIELDNAALAETFADYHISFLASNSTYASEQEIMNQACKMPYLTREFLSWTAGITPLFLVWVIYKIVLYVRCRSKPMKVVKIEEPEVEIEMTAPDRPPMTPLYVPRHVEPNSYDEPKGIRRRVRKKEMEDKPKGPSVVEKLTALSPSIKNRIMNNGAMV